MLLKTLILQGIRGHYMEKDLDFRQVFVNYMSDYVTLKRGLYLVPALTLFYLGILILGIISRYQYFTGHILRPTFLGRQSLIFLFFPYMAISAFHGKAT